MTAPFIFQRICVCGAPADKHYVRGRGPCKEKLCPCRAFELAQRGDT